MKEIQDEKEPLRVAAGVADGHRMKRYHKCVFLLGGRKSLERRRNSHNVRWRPSTRIYAPLPPPMLQSNAGFSLSVRHRRNNPSVNRRSAVLFLETGHRWQARGSRASKRKQSEIVLSSSGGSLRWYMQWLDALGRVGRAVGMPCVAEAAACPQHEGRLDKSRSRRACRRPWGGRLSTI